MTATEIRMLAIDILRGIAPEVDFDRLGDGDGLRETLDLDSMDFLNFVIALHKATGIDIPETDYHLLDTLAGLQSYLSGDAPRGREA